MEQFPVSAPEFDGNCRTVPAGSAFEWLKQGWATFMANPGIWIAMTVIFFVIFLGLSIVPLIGQLAANLLTPVFGAGLLLACKKVAENGTLEIPDLFAGFKTSNTSNLILLGVIYMAAMLAIMAVGVLFGGGSLAGGMMMGNSASGAGVAVGGMLVALLLTLVLTVPLVMAMWFAPALVTFNNMQPVPALKASFNACLKNMMVFLVYGLITLVLCFFAALPLGLGFLVLVPVLAGTLYASYRDIFVAA